MKKVSSSEKSSKSSSKIRRGLRQMGWWNRPAALKALSHLAENQPTFGNKIQIFHEGDDLYDTIIEEISAAKKRVWFEIYMIWSDATGWRFANALADKAKEGVEVRVIYDSAGSWDANEKVFEVMMDAGVHVLEFRPLKPWRKHFGFFGRNHRKVCVVDQKVGYIGGINVADLWSKRECEDSPWRDTHLRLEGPAATDLAALFVSTWHHETGEKLAVDDLRHQETKARSCDEHAEGKEGGVCVVGRHGKLRSKIRRLYMLQIMKAEEQLYIMQSYFVPDRSIRNELIKAAQRGVDVRIILPKESDISLADNASRYYFEKFLKNGVRIYLWKPSVLHAKVSIVDGGWASVGSGNFDHLSLDHNKEANALLMDTSAVKELTDRFCKDLEQCDEVDLKEWRKRPKTQRMKERVSVVFRPWL